MGLRRTWAVALCLLPIGLAACGGSSSNSSTTTPSAIKKGGVVSSPAQVAKATPPAQEKQLSTCMAAHGNPQPKPGAKVASAATIAAAQKACAQYIPASARATTVAPVGSTPTQQSMNVALLLKAVSCMHKNGVKLLLSVPANAPKDAVIFSQAVALHVAVTSPADTKAVKACNTQITAFNTAIQAPQKSSNG
jgi:hypothetical protein